MTGMKSKQASAVVPSMGLLIALGCISMAQPRESCAPPGRRMESFQGEVCLGHSFEHSFGPGFEFRLIPNEKGWTIAVIEKDTEEDLTRLTPPLHGSNPTVIYGWHFRNETNTGPNDGSLNVPTERRLFIYSPEVPSLIQKGRVDMEDVRRVGAYGKGELRILDYGLADLLEGRQARMVWMRFSVCVSWPGS